MTGNRRELGYVIHWQEVREAFRQSASGTVKAVPFLGDERKRPACPVRRQRFPMGPLGRSALGKCVLTAMRHVLWERSSFFFLADGMISSWKK